ETTTLSLPAVHDLVTIDFVPSAHSVRSVAQIGRNSVAHATAVGKVLLAWGGQLPEGELPAYTERTITDREALAREIEQVRRRGWAQAIGEREDERSEEHTSELQSRENLVCRLLLEKNNLRMK